MSPTAITVGVLCLAFLVWLIVFVLMEIVNQRRGKKSILQQTAFSQKLNPAEIVFTVLFCLIVVLLIATLPAQYTFITQIMASVFTSIIVYGWEQKRQIQQKKQPKNKYPTIEDIQRKYPKRKPIETPTDGIYEDFSRELTPTERVEGETIEVDEPLFNRLLELCHGNREVAIGFILRNMVEGKSAQWACERVVAKIESHIPRR